jgi:type I restriction enzyme S subunit
MSNMELNDHTPVECDLPAGWVFESLKPHIRSRSGDSKIIKGKQQAEPAAGLIQGFSASGPDVWVTSAQYEVAGVAVSAVGARCGKTFLANPPWTAIANTHALIPDDYIDVRFLWHLSNREEWWIKSGTAQPFVKVKDTLERPMPIPPLAEQERIVEILEEQLSRLDAALESVRVVREKAAQFRRSLLHAAFTGTLTGHNPEDGQLPEGWRVGPLNEFCEMYQPKTISTKELIDHGEFPVYGANGQIGFYDQFNHADSEVTVTCRGATCGTVNVIPARSWITGNAMVVRPLHGSVSRPFLAYELQSIDMTAVITGTAQPQITRTTLAPMSITVPPLAEQERIVEILEEQLSRLDAALAVADAIEKRSAALRRSLLHAAFTGRLTEQWRELSRV